MPVIDISGDRRKVVGEVGAACGELGFLTVVGHGVPEESSPSDRVRDARVLRPSRAERSARWPTASRSLGLPAYRPLRSESLAASLGQTTPGDLKESLDWGPAVSRVTAGPRAPGAAGGASRSTTRPSPASASGCAASSRSRSACPRTGSSDAFRDHSSSMRVVNYPAPEGELEPGQLRAGAHTDYGCMTILRTEDAPGGLQVQTRGRRLARRPRRSRIVRGQPRRHDGPLDERPLAGDAPPRRRSARRPRGREPPPDDRLLPRPAAGRGDRLHPELRRSDTTRPATSR